MGKYYLVCGTLIGILLLILISQWTGGNAACLNHKLLQFGAKEQKGVPPVQESQAINLIRVSHVGFMRNATKRFFIENPPEGKFKVEYLRDVKYSVVFEGELTRVEGELTHIEGELCSGWIGDFSQLTNEGNYRICCGGLRSRHFVVWDKVYDMPTRMMLNYFTMQRCGHPLGWAGLCHQDDGYISETGEHVDLTGGYHQSCDLRKSPAGLSIGVLGLVKFAIHDNFPHWGTQSIPDEIRWACDYFVKTIQPNGCMYNTLNETTNPNDSFGWGGRVFYRSGAPASAQWNVMRALTLSSGLISERSDVYLKTAKRMWNYMVNERPAGKYRHPGTSLPLGMDAADFYAASFKGSTADICARVAAAADFYRTTHEPKWLEEVENGANDICSRFVGGDSIAAACLLIDKNVFEIMESSGTYGWIGSGLLSLCDALEVMPRSNSANKWRACLEKVLQQQIHVAEKNIWGISPRFFTNKDLDKQVGHFSPGKTRPTRRESLLSSGKLGPVCNSAQSLGQDKIHLFSENAIRPSLAAYRILLLHKISNMLDKPDCMSLAQQYIDGIFGFNTSDSSHIEAVGYNQALVPVFGQFFPSTPQIPGAVGIPEYDLPIVGMLMWALGDMARDAGSR